MCTIKLDKNEKERRSARSRIGSERYNYERKIVLQKRKDVAMNENKIREMWRQFIFKNGHRPKYVSCRVVFYEDVDRTRIGSGKDETIALYCNPEGNDNDANDNEIFYYCESFSDFLRLILPDMEDFLVVDVYEFLDEII